MCKFIKSLTVMALAVCILLVGVTSVSAATRNIDVVAESKTVEAGETFDVKLNVTSNTGVTVLRLCVAYDTDVLTLVGATDGGILSGADLSDNYTSPYRLVWMDALATGNNTATGTVVTLKFKAASDVVDASSTYIEVFTLSDNDVLDCNMQVVSIAATDGKITFSNAAVKNDFDGDGSVTADDAIHLLYYTLGTDGYYLNQSADLNGDGNVTSDDAVILLYNIHFGDTLYPLN